jgi:hypothetical protein
MYLLNTLSPVSLSDEEIKEVSKPGAVWPCVNDRVQ